jgi:hypothetical protein
VVGAGCSGDVGRARTEALVLGLRPLKHTALGAVFGAPDRSLFGDRDRRLGAVDDDGVDRRAK